MSSEDPGPPSNYRRRIVFVTDGQLFLGVRRTQTKSKWVLPCTDLFPIEKPLLVIRKRTVASILDQVTYGAGSAFFKLVMTEKKCQVIDEQINIFGVRGHVLCFTVEKAYLKFLCDASNNSKNF